MNIKYVILGCVLILFILIATGISCGAVPYSSTAVYSKYEGFEASTFNAKLTELVAALKKLPSADSNEKQIGIIERELSKQSYSMSAVIENVREIALKVKTNPQTPGVGDAKAEEFTRDFMTWYDSSLTVTASDKLANVVADADAKAKNDTDAKAKAEADAKTKSEVDAKAAADAKAAEDAAKALVDAAAKDKALNLGSPPIMTPPTATPPAPPTATPPAPPTATPVKSGFTTISASDYKSSGIIDIFSSATGSMTCSKVSSGLTNSLGPLCLSKEQLYMLQSRGGNSTGRDSQIGA
jgi:hypothetical protein